MKTAVIDLGFGDSGKGSVTAALCHIYHNDNPIVVRYCGGPQAGHTVFDKDKDIRHTFSSFGSGTLQGVPTYWSENCAFNPIAFLNELDVLKSKGITPPKYFISSQCPIITFLDIEHNQEKEDTNQHGSCGCGFGTTIEREENYYSLKIIDIAFESIFCHKFNAIAHYYNSNIVANIPKYKNLFEHCEECLKYITIIDSFEEIKSEHDFVIYESSQGLMLDKDTGFFPNVTRANVGYKAINDKLNSIYYVTRAYQTRHGNGPMPTENIPHTIQRNPNESNITNKYQGEFRIGILDLDILEYTVLRDRCPLRVKKNLVITCLDHITEYKLFYQGGILRFDNEQDFITKIKTTLCVDTVYVSRSDDFKEIKVA